MFEIKNLNLKDLHFNKGQVDGLPQNPRFIKNKRFEALKKSIEDAPEMLSLREIIAYDNDGELVVIGGNMRLLALKDLGYKEAVVKVLDKDTPVEKLREYAIKDNVGFGEDDFDILANEWNFDELTEWGMKIPKIELKKDVEEDEEPDRVEGRTKKGDVWKLGKHLLVCGDATNEEDVNKLMRGDLADLLLTDPPYNVNYEGGTKQKLKIKNDKMGDVEFRQFLCNSFSCAKNVMKGGASFYIWHADLEGFNFRYACQEVGLKVKECLIWNKNSLVLGRQDYQWKHEPCLYGWVDGDSHKFYGDRKQTTVIDLDRPRRSTEHPTMKPVGLFAYLINNSSKEGDVILDTFGGSGTTMIACEQMGRIAKLMELDEHYCDVIIQRWENLTNENAVLIER